MKRIEIRDSLGLAGSRVHHSSGSKPIKWRERRIIQIRSLGDQDTHRISQGK